MAMFASSSATAQQITLSNTNTVSENFDSMGTNAAAVLPNGLKMTAAGQALVRPQML
jgi:hypothetical protein